MVTTTHPKRPIPQANNPQSLAMLRFIEAGEHALAQIEDAAEREVRAEQLREELQRRFTPEIKTKDAEDAYYQAAHDREDAESTYADYEEGDGEGKDHFRSHLKVKCMDSVKQPTLTVRLMHKGTEVGEVKIKPLPVNQFPETIVQGPDKQIMREQGLAFQEYPPTGPYHSRVASWTASRASRPKQDLECQYCHGSFEGRKGQKFCSPECRKRDNEGVPLSVDDVNEYGEFGCEEVYEMFLQLRLEYLMDKHQVEELTSGMELDATEKENILECAKHIVEGTFR